MRNTFLSEAGMAPIHAMDMTPVRNVHTTILKGKTTMNNKSIGTRFERQACEYLRQNGWWVHFLSPNQWGAQPFDIIAIRGGKTYALDCKTCKTKTFLLSRVEDNQFLSFSALTRDSNAECGFLISHDDKIYYINFSYINKIINDGGKTIRLTEEMAEDAGRRFKRN